MNLEHNQILGTGLGNQRAVGVVRNLLNPPNQEQVAHAFIVEKLLQLLKEATSNRMSKVRPISQDPEFHRMVHPDNFRNWINKVEQVDFRLQEASDSYKFKSVAARVFKVEAAHITV